MASGSGPSSATGKITPATGTTAAAEMTAAQAATEEMAAPVLIEKTAAPFAKGKEAEMTVAGGGSQGKSYRSALSPRAAHRGYNLEYVEPAMEAGERIFEYSPEDLVEGSQRWRTAAVGFVMGLKPTFTAMHKYASIRWKEFGVVEVLTIASGWFVYKFETEEVRDRVLEMGPWSFAKRPLLLKPWTADTEMNQTTLDSLPIWIRLPGLKLCFWTPEMLSRISSLIGRPVCSDGLTATQSRISFARICVEISAKSELPDKLIFRDKKGRRTEQLVEYEWLPKVCEVCEKLGHKATQCTVQVTNFVIPAMNGEVDASARKKDDLTNDLVGLDVLCEGLKQREDGSLGIGSENLKGVARTGAIQVPGAIEYSVAKVDRVIDNEHTIVSEGDTPLVVDTRGLVSPASVNPLKVLVNENKGSANEGVENNNPEIWNVIKGKDMCRNHGMDDSDKDKTQQNTFAILSDATHEECEEEINQTPYTRDRGRPRGATKDKNARLLGSPGRNTRGRKKQVSQYLESQKDAYMGNHYVKKDKANLNDNKEVPEVAAKDDPDVIAVSKLTYEFVVAVSKRKRKSPWSKEEFEKEIVRLKEAGAEMVKIY